MIEESENLNSHFSSGELHQLLAAAQRRTVLRHVPEDPRAAAQGAGRRACARWPRLRPYAACRRRPSADSKPCRRVRSGPRTWRPARAHGAAGRDLHGCSDHRPQASDKRLLPASSRPALFRLIFGLERKYWNPTYLFFGTGRNHGWVLCVIRRSLPSEMPRTNWLWLPACVEHPPSFRSGCRRDASDRQGPAGGERRAWQTSSRETVQIRQPRTWQVLPATDLTKRIRHPNPRSRTQPAVGAWLEGVTAVQGRSACRVSSRRSTSSEVL